MYSGMPTISWYSQYAGIKDKDINGVKSTAKFPQVCHHGMWSHVAIPHSQNKFQSSNLAWCWALPLA
jgi:hypothetical protein